MKPSIRPLWLALALFPLPLLAQETLPADTPSAAETPASAQTKYGEPVKAKTLEQLTVVGRRENLVGEAISASEGSIGQEEISARPSNRTGDLLEFVPGLVVTQHSGSGKANQYFLRGFNLDHGTDFATFVDGMPVNMRTHAHGQGYSDLNFLIPETVSELTYRKGVYYADVGDFSSAGSARLSLADSVPDGQAELTAGGYGYRRGLLLNSSKVGAGNLLYAAELQTYDGPWANINEDVKKGSVLLRYSAPLAGGWKGPVWGGDFDASAYVIDYRLNLWSNFTYFLDDPMRGDQFEQVDRRKIYGFTLSQQWENGRSHWRIGSDGRYDDIGEVGLFHTQKRRVIGTVRDDSVGESSVGVYAANEFRFNDQLRSYIGVREDAYRFNVDSSLPVNSGNATASKGS